MKINGLAVSGLDPPKELSDDGVSIPIPGLTWQFTGSCFINLYLKDVQSLQKIEEDLSGDFSVNEAFESDLNCTGDLNIYLRS